MASSARSPNNVGPGEYNSQTFGERLETRTPDALIKNSPSDQTTSIYPDLSRFESKGGHEHEPR
jgi:hypothetical protein